MHQASASERASVGHDDQVVLLSSPRRKIDARPTGAGDQSGRVATRKRVRAQAPQKRLDGTAVVCSSTPDRAFSLLPSPGRPPSPSHPLSISLSLSFSFSLSLSISLSPCRSSSLRARKARRSGDFRSGNPSTANPRVSKSSRTTTINQLLDRDNILDVAREGLRSVPLQAPAQASRQARAPASQPARVSIRAGAPLLGRIRPRLVASRKPRRTFTSRGFLRADS